MIVLMNVIDSKEAQIRSKAFSGSAQQAMDWREENCNVAVSPKASYFSRTIWLFDENAEEESFRKPEYVDATIVLFLHIFTSVRFIRHIKNVNNQNQFSC